ncbi:MAG: transcription-repair coupling factor [Muribaculaceae bacterium]|nr:transcription-repair coupling factor [Muribaculaceae bacterium]
MSGITLATLLADFNSPARSKALKKLVKDCAKAPVALCGLAGSSAAMAIAGLPRGKSPAIIIGADADDAGYLYHDLSRLLGEEALAVLPSGYKRDIRYGQPDPPAVILRTEAMARLENDPDLRFVITYPEAMAEQVASREEMSAGTISLKNGSSHSLSQLEVKLRELGFSEVDYVYEPGQFAVRGSIVDIFGYSNELPYRIDFFDDEIDSIRTFDTETQLSAQRLDSVTITANVEQRPGGVSLLEFIAPDTLMIVRRPDSVVDRIRAIAGEKLSVSATITAETAEVDTNAMERVVNPDEFERLYMTFPRLTFTAAPDAPDAKASIDFDCSPQGLYHKNFNLISETFTKLTADGYRICILSDNPHQFERLRVIFEDRGDNIAFTPVDGTLHEGFVDHPGRVCVFTDHQIFDRFHKYTLRSDRARSGRVALSLKELNALEVGDYVVHVDHGVGKFAGLLRTDVGGRTQEMIKLVYQNNDIIMVSIHALHKLAKYRGKEGVPPKLNRIGSGQWNKIKERTKSKLKDIARDLIRLYAARREQKGFAFSPDSYMQEELEASFIYEDTPDQLTATQAVKADMESDRPMDRLVCGDVGFGKTEVAIRAAFKAAVDGKQVAVLVPTTVLAYQHFNTFRDRLKDFPVRVDYLSRARSPKQTKEILADLEAGKIDIIIGTHKLIGKTVKFKDLGLLIVDEEQKFGVAVKEKLKQLKVNVDTLTMSATPIPRTLQFSLMGARDLSSINTPPPNRYPIVTTVAALDDDTVREAINFEMARGGQVFFVNHRIEGLYELESMIRRLVPDARIAVGHGQMPPEQLEKTIVDFAAHDYDVLLSTTIIESGIDMPRVNTIIVNNAQNFGLSELHQLRGRVGRSSRKAFCYLMVPPGRPLTPVARRRLQAIESFSDLGSGIHIAMQDLDIRGAGNLLGAEQSGFIADLGYETYQKILKEAVTELRAEEFADMPAAQNDVTSSDDFAADCVVETDMELLLPATYVPQASERISLYQELDSLEREDAVKAFAERLRDRFGPIPPETEALLLVPRLRRLARRLGIEKVNLKGGVMYIYFVDQSNEAYYKSPMFGRVLSYLSLHPRRVKIRTESVRNSFSILNVKEIGTAVQVLDDMLNLPPS